MTTGIWTTQTWVSSKHGIITYSHTHSGELRAFYFGDGNDRGRSARSARSAKAASRRSPGSHLDTCSGAVSIDLGPQMAADRVASRRAMPLVKAFWLPESRGQLGSFGTIVYTCSGAVSIDLGPQMADDRVPSRRARPLTKEFWLPESRGQLGSFSPGSGKACDPVA